MLSVHGVANQSCCRHGIGIDLWQGQLNGITIESHQVDYRRVMGRDGAEEALMRAFLAQN
ncbi:MAG: hypothetical protein J6X55_08710 [Victivallales bacterium]|nr:hypothetical protein [Victivallales bacterium]